MKYYYQISNYDCGTTSLLNALNMVLSRDEICPDFLKAIYHHSLDDMGHEKIGYKGTSNKSMQHIAYLLNSYAKEKHIGLEVIFKEKENIQDLLSMLEQGYIAIVRCYLEDDHYIIINKIKDNNVYAWDPYYLDLNQSDKEVEIILDNENYNRIFSLDRLKQIPYDFSLMRKENRCSVYFKHK